MPRAGNRHFLGSRMQKAKDPIPPSMDHFWCILITTCLWEDVARNGYKAIKERLEEMRSMLFRFVSRFLPNDTNYLTISPAMREIDEAGLQVVVGVPSSTKGEFRMGYGIVPKGRFVEDVFSVILVIIMGLNSYTHYYWTRSYYRDSTIGDFENNLQGIIQQNIDYCL
ncbi:hypothetical protein CEXT_40311 [Caerostris extrusa]|uniref:PiggyBac transposable element-derived protein domain-containing protein n=1 Tax=Caerostris extrusa TaxID=172846 RepID=A0AAV4PB84_CAEEX|nr:hypothetical protein CEXT_40311 [Caerostris extrusa]